MMTVLLLGFGMVAAVQDEAWDAYKTGDLVRAQELVRPSDDRGRHLQALLHHLKGRHEKCIEFVQKIDSDYLKSEKQLVEAAGWSYMHLGRYEDGRKFLEKFEDTSLAMISNREMAKQPLKVKLERVAVIDMVDPTSQLNSLFPAFAGKINGHEHAVHMDTGGNWVLMNPATCKKFGIETVPAGEGSAMGRAKLGFGIADRFALGDVEMKNVPVISVSTLQGSVDFVIFGTNIFQQFLSTLHYAENRLLLSPRGNAKLRKQHLAMLKGKMTRVPFAMWADHYQIARGTIGARKDFNFFVDSGLVTLLPDAKGGQRQPGISAPKKFWEEVGFKKDGRGYSGQARVGLGGFTLENSFATAGTRGLEEAAGIPIHVLISHGWLKRTGAWTMDFDAMEYLFHAAEK